MSRDHHDALIDQLLRELLGGDRPRDLTQRVLTGAAAHDRGRRVWWISSAAGIAAAVAIAVGLWAWWPASYPGPQVIAGTVQVNTQTLEHGSRIETDQDPASLKLGDYVDLTLAPETALTLGGARYQEKIFLERGEVQAQVTRHRGKFDVIIGPVNVQVTGTKFGVQVLDEADEAQVRQQKKVRVSVSEGSVLVQGVASPRTLLAGDSGTFDVSSAPILKSAQGLAAAEAAAGGEPVRTGINIGAAEGNRIGTRGVPVLRPPAGQPATRAGTTKPATRSGGGNTLRGGEISTITPQVMLQNGTVTLGGILRRNSEGMYYLETEKGNFLLFPQRLPPEGFQADVGGRYRVTWIDQKYARIVEVGRGAGGNR